MTPNIKFYVISVDNQESVIPALNDEQVENYLLELEEAFTCPYDDSALPSIETCFSRGFDTREEAEANIER